MPGLRPGHPRLSCLNEVRTWMPGTKPGHDDLRHHTHSISCNLSPTLRRRQPNYCAATLLDCLAARSLSITVRQPVLRSARCLYMQAVIFGMLGISELQSRNASPVHICCASALKAKLEVEDSADRETAKASTKPAWRSVLAR